MIRSARSFFQGRDYLEVETPQLVTEQAPELHIEAIPCNERFLHTSPELCMKRLLSSGYSRIFQIARVFRAGERGRCHLPEFSLLEWYRAGTDYRGLMCECEDLFVAVSRSLGLGERIRYCGKEISLLPPWERLTVAEAFDRYGSVSLDEALASGLEDQIITAEVAPRLGFPRPTFLYDYPSSSGSLARLKAGMPKVAERFEIYLAGMELANGFSELTDPREQRERFEWELQRRRNAGKISYPMPERFLAALEDMPESAGIALGLDRMAMIFADVRRIDQVVALTPEEA